MGRKGSGREGRTLAKVLVTGGAGFIGSHLVDHLLGGGDSVTVMDDFSSGDAANLPREPPAGELSVVRADLKAGEGLDLKGFETVYHFAADPDVRAGTADPGVHFRENILSTYNLLEAARRSGTVRTLVFPSTSAVYGRAARVPTPEDYGPLVPISTYAGSKLACESLVSAYASSYGFRAVIFRLANVTGPRVRHGVVFDLVNKLRERPGELEVLGDGRQSKSYVHVADCVSGIAVGTEKSGPAVTLLNLGSEDRVSVSEIASMVCEEMGLKDVQIRPRAVSQDGGGWVGDVVQMQLDVSRLKKLGWRPTMNSAEAVRATARHLAGQGSHGGR